MNHFLDSPISLQTNNNNKSPTLIDILHTPSKETKTKNTTVTNRETDSSNSSTTVDEFCEVSFENLKLKKLFKKKPHQK